MGNINTVGPNEALVISGSQIYTCVNLPVILICAALYAV